MATLRSTPSSSSSAPGLAIKIGSVGRWFVLGIQVFHVCLRVYLDNRVDKVARLIDVQYIGIAVRFAQVGLVDAWLHTKVDAESQFEQSMKDRPGLVAKMFGVPSAKHHFFFENIEDPNEPISVYLSHMAISDFRNSLFLEDRSQRVINLKYPKTDGHNALDSRIHSALDIDEMWYQNKDAAFNREISDSETNLRRLKAREVAEHVSLGELCNQVDALDTYELVQMRKCRGYERGHMFSYSTVTFSFSTDYPIRKIERNPSSPAYPTWHSYDDSETLGEKRYYNYLESDKWNSSVDCEVTVYGYKKEVKADEISRLTREKDEALEDVKNTMKEIQETKDKIEKAKENLVANRKEIDRIAVHRKKLTQRYMPLESIKEKGQYLATTSILSYSYALGGISNRILASQFPTSYIESSRSQAIEKYTNKTRTYESMLEICDSMLSSLSQTISNLDSCRSKLQTVLKSLVETVAHTKKSLDELETFTATDVSGWPIADQKEALKAFVLFRPYFEPLLISSRATTEEVICQHGEQLVAREAFAHACLQAIKTQLEKHKESHTKWKGMKRGVEASLEAAKHLCKLGGMFGIDEFCVLKQAIDQFSPDSNKVWDALFEQLRQSYLDDPGNWRNLQGTL